MTSLEAQMFDWYFSLDKNKHFKLQLQDAIYRLRFYSKSLILSLSNSHNNIASIQKNRGDKSHRAIVALQIAVLRQQLVLSKIVLIITGIVKSSNCRRMWFLLLFC